MNRRTLLRVLPALLCGGGIPVGSVVAASAAASAAAATAHGHSGHAPAGGGRAAAGAGDAGDAAIEVFGHGSWRALKQALAGRPAVVHVWGLTCAPCLIELPDWGRLAAAQPGSQLVFIQFDPMPRARVAATMRRAGIDRARNYSVAAPPDERLHFEVDPDWGGQLPRTLLIAADGSTADAVSGSIDLGRVSAWLSSRQPPAPR